MFWYQSVIHSAAMKHTGGNLDKSNYKKYDPRWNCDVEESENVNVHPHHNITIGSMISGKKTRQENSQYCCLSSHIEFYKNRGCCLLLEH